MNGLEESSQVVPGVTGSGGRTRGQAANGVALLLFIAEVWIGFARRWPDLAQIGIVPVNCSLELNYNAPPVRGNSICRLYRVNGRSG